MERKKKATPPPPSVKDPGAQYDAHCRKVMSFIPFLAVLLRAVVPEFRGMSPEEVEACIVKPVVVSETPVFPIVDKVHGFLCGLCNEDLTISEGLRRYDLLFNVVIPGKRPCRLIINLELQKKYHLGYPLLIRALFYCARLLSSQWGTVFKGSKYGKIQKVYSIWICMNPPLKFEDSINIYAPFERHLRGSMRQAKNSYDRISSVLICVAKTQPPQMPQAKNDQDDPQDDPNDPLYKLSMLLYYLFSPYVSEDDKVAYLKENFGITENNAVGKEIKEMGELAKGVLETGVRMGIAQGITQGITQGTNRARAEAVLALTAELGFSVERAMDVLHIPWEERGHIRELMVQIRKEAVST